MFSLQLLCNQPITGCVRIAPTTNFIAVTLGKTKPNHSVEETSLPADDRDSLTQKECTENTDKHQNNSVFCGTHKVQAKPNSLHPNLDQANWGFI